MPIYVLKSNTIPQMQSSLTSIFSLEIDPREAALRETEEAIERRPLVRPSRSSCRRRTRTSAGSSTRWPSARTSCRARAAASRTGGSACTRMRLAAAGDDRSGSVAAGRFRRPLHAGRRHGDQRALGMTTPSPAVRRRLGLRAGLRRLRIGLLAYGTVGLLLALVGLAALVGVNGRMSALAERVDVEVGQLADAIDSSATALKDAGASATSFTTTLERTPPSVRQAAVTVRNLRPSLRDPETQLSAINILGSQPFGRAAALFGTMATDLEGLDTRLDLIATDLEGNRGALVTNARSLDALGTRLAAQAARLRSGMVHDGLADVRARLLWPWSPSSPGPPSRLLARWPWAGGCGGSSTRRRSSSRGSHRHPVYRGPAAPLPLSAGRHPLDGLERAIDFGGGVVVDEAEPQHPADCPPCRAAR